MPRKLLPPPVETILIYAAYGFAQRNKLIAPSGKPRLPEREIWAVFFSKLAETERGIAQIKSYAYTGMNAWNVPNSISSCLEDAFKWRSIQAAIKATLKHMLEFVRVRHEEKEPTRNASKPQQRTDAAPHRQLPRQKPTFTPFPKP